MPCATCLKKFGRPCCTHIGCCVFEDVPGTSPEKILGELPN